VARHQTVRDEKFKFYLKDGSSAGGRFVQIGNSLLLSKRFQALSPLARWMYFALAMEAAGKDVVSMSHSQAKKYGITPSGYDNAVRQLKDGGFIRLDDGLGRLETNRFRFVRDWQQRAPPDPGSS
jgi:hypothetical protein